MPEHDLFHAGARARVWPNATAWRGASAGCVGRIARAGPHALPRLLHEAARVCRAAGDTWLFAPMDGDIWHDHRLATGGMLRPFFAMEPAADPALLACLMKTGFAPVLQYESSEVDLASAYTRGVSAPSVRIRHFNLANASAELARMHALSQSAFASAPLFTPIGPDAFAALYTTVLPRIEPALALFAEDAVGIPLGFLFGLPDFMQGETPDTAILNMYTALRPGVGQVLSAAFHSAARQMGFARVIHAPTHADHASLRHSRLLGATTLRHYALFARDLRV